MQKKCLVSVSIKAIESDKAKMIETFRSSRSSATMPNPGPSSITALASSSASPPTDLLPTNNSSPPLHDYSSPANTNGHSLQDVDEDSGERGDLPPMKYNFDNAGGEGWTKFEKEICYVYAGKGPFVAR